MANIKHWFQHVFTWKIKQFSLCRNARGEPLKSPLFKTNMTGKMNWYLVFYPAGITLEEAEGYTACYLCRAEDSIDEIISYRFCFEIIDENGKVIFSTAKITAELRSNCYSGYNIFKEIDKVKDECNCFPDDILIIRCRMDGESSGKGFYSVNFAETMIGADRAIFNFKVDSKNSAYRNFIFQCPVSVKYEMTFHIPQDEVHVTIEKLENDDDDTTKAIFKISLLDMNNAECHSGMYQHVFQEGEALWRMSNLIKKSDIFDEGNKYLKNGVATIKCEFCTANGTEVYQTYERRDEQNLPGQAAFPPIEPLVALQGDLKRFYMSSKKSDVILRAAGIELPAHTVILSARSPVFADLFKRRRRRYVDFPSVEANVLREFVEYLYTGILENIDTETIRKLKELGDQYQVLSLIDECNIFLNGFV